MYQIAELKQPLIGAKGFTWVKKGEAYIPEEGGKRTQPCYLCLHGGYYHKEPMNKLDKSYNPKNQVLCMTFDVDRDCIYWQKIGLENKETEGNDEQVLPYTTWEIGLDHRGQAIDFQSSEDEYWDLENYVLVPLENQVYVVGGKSKFEDPERIQMNMPMYVIDK